MSEQHSLTYTPPRGDVHTEPGAIRFVIVALAVLFLLVFVVLPHGGRGVLAAAGRGAAFGFVAYATYDLTNLATLQAFTWRLALIDMAWGTLATALASAAGAAAARRA